MDPVVPGPTVAWRLLRYRRLIAIFAAVVAADQATKAWIAHALPYGTYGAAAGAITVIRGFFYIVHVGNTGAAWSILAGRSLLLAGLAACALAAIFLWRKALGLLSGPNQTCFGLICGGIAGNLVDRVARGHVVDFLDLHFGTYVYPTFNVADSAICVGVGLYVLASLRTPKAAFP
ncbi:MAG TPA: signal peptidase II [Opitutaceae bacterium]|jgi:signal peptidase II